MRFIIISIAALVPLNRRKTMKRIQILDCTLRDGGYCNNCCFGFENEKKIINKEELERL